VSTIGDDELARLEALREPLQEGAADQNDLLHFYDFIAHRDVAGVVHSMKADAICASGDAIAAMLAPETAVLDVGCNIGYLTTWYAAKHPSIQVTGIDVSGNSIATAQAIARELGIDNVEFIHGDARDCLPGRTFDTIIDTQSVQFAERSGELLQWISASLREGGRFLSIPALIGFEDFLIFRNCMDAADITITAAEPVVHADLGQPGGYLLLTMAREGKALRESPESVWRRLRKAIGHGLEDDAD